jgi:tetratricopeptide (TPR) repeat protein
METDRVPMDANRSSSIAAVLALSLLSCPLSAQSTSKTVRHRKVAEADSSPTIQLTQAETAIEKKDYASAEPLLKKVTAGDPNNYLAWFDLGFVYSALGKTDDSIAAYRKSVAAKPDIFESNLNLGLMLAKTDQPDAEQFLRTATKLKPSAHVEEGQARAWLSLAKVLEKAKPDEAIEAYHQASVLQPKDPEPHLSAGLLLEKQDKATEAEQEYKHVVELDPSSADALAGLANIYMGGQRYSEADDVLRKLLALRPNDAGAHMQLGRILAIAGHNEDAIGELQTALKLAPSDTDVQRDLAELFVTADKFDEAELQYRSLVTAKPRDAELHARLGQTLMKQHKFPEAQQELLAAVQLKPDFGDAYDNLALAANENKNYELAIKALEARAKFVPENPGSYFLRATTYDHLRDYKRAAENYHKFLEVAEGKFPDQEWQARHRLIAIEPKK